MAILSSCQLICTVAHLIWTHHWMGHEKPPQFDLSYVKFPGMYLNLLCQFYLHVSWFVQLHSRFDITNGFALKNYTNLTFHLLNSLVCIRLFTFQKNFRSEAPPSYFQCRLVQLTRNHLHFCQKLTPASPVFSLVLLLKAIFMNIYTAFRSKTKQKPELLESISGKREDDSLLVAPIYIENS